VIHELVGHKLVHVEILIKLLCNGVFLLQRRAITMLSYDILWRIWTARNKLIFEDIMPDWIVGILPIMWLPLSKKMVAIVKEGGYNSGLLVAANNHCLMSKLGKFGSHHC
jgi:hypothetical protein